MSMISAQCDLLQTMAAWLVVHDMPDAATSVRYAADTILELRDDLQRANAENAENAGLLKLLQRTWDAFHDATAREFVTVKNELRELGVEVDG